MINKVVILDIDDVSMPWAETVHQKCVEAGLTDLPTHTQWEMYKSYVLKDGTPCSLEQWLEVVDAQVVPGGLYHQPPYPGVIDAVHQLFYADIPVYFVTARGFFAHADEIKAWTQEWVRKYFGLRPHLYFSQDKGEIALEIGATHAIDDRIKNVEELAEVGVKTYLMRQPHNQHDTYPELWRVDSVAEFVEKVLLDV